MNDKFNCIENHLIHSDDELLQLLENYFENYLNNDTTHVLLYDYILQIKYFNKELINSDKIYNIIKTQKEKYYTNLKTTIRLEIKKNIFTMVKLIDYINEIKIKTDFINNIFHANHNIHIIEDYGVLIILHDPIIKLFMENNIQVEVFKKILYILKSFTFTNLYCEFIRLMSTMYKTQLQNTKYELIIPTNIVNIMRFNDNIEKIFLLRQEYNFLQNNKYILLFPLYENILNYFIDIILKNTDVYSIDIIIKHNYNKLQIIIDSVDKQLLTVLQSQMHHKLLHGGNLNITKIMNYLKFMKINPIKTGNVYTNIVTELVNNENNINELFGLFNKQVFSLDTNAIETIMYLLNHHNNIDIIINMYKEHLITRMLHIYTYIDINNICVHSNFEENIVRYFTMIPRSLEFSIHGIIKDIKNSASFTKHLYNNNLVDKSSNTTVVTASHNWNINLTEGLNTIDEVYSKSSLLLSNTSIMYCKFHNNNRILSWALHYGEINMTYMDIEIKLLPIQLSILELFDISDNIHIDDIININILKTYSIKTRMNLIQSLVNSKLLKMKNDILLLNSTTKFDTDLILCYHSITNSSTTFNKLENLQHTRQEIIIANINSQVKLKSLNSQELFRKVKQHIKMFQLEEELFNKTIDIMVDKSYIEIKDGMIMKVY